MNKPIATIRAHGYGWGPRGTGYGVFIGERLIKRAASLSTLEDTERIINAEFADLQARHDHLHSTLKQVAAYFSLLREQGSPEELMPMARHDVEGAVNVALALDSREDTP